MTDHPATQLGLDPARTPRCVCRPGIAPVILEKTHVRRDQIVERVGALMRRIGSTASIASRTTVRMACSFEANRRRRSQGGLGLLTDRLDGGPIQPVLCNE